MAKSVAKPQRELTKSNLTNKGRLKFGNRDAEHEYDLTRHGALPGHYVVKHFNYMTNGAGQSIPDESTERIQIYEPEDFDRLNDQGHKKGEQKQSFFESQGMGTVVLHEPE